MSKHRPELIWPGKADLVIEAPAELVEAPELGHRAGPGLCDNRLIHGDNVPALAALARELAGQVKCVYIDPPYNTGTTFTHYRDGAAHAQWLSRMSATLRLCRPLLRPDGFLFVQIDSREQAYLKVLLDEVFGRGRWVNDIIWKRRGGSANPNSRLNNVTDFILWYANSDDYTIERVYALDDNTRAYIAERFVHTHQGRRFMLAPVERNAALGERANLRYEYKGYVPRYGWMMNRVKLERLDTEGRLHWNSRGRPNRRVFLEDYRGQPIGNLWTDVKVINPMAQERLDFEGQKPEALLQRILELSTRPGEWVLDAFAGSGTTGAVAHKMGRRWVMIEQGAHCESVIAPRLRRVVEGMDRGGISAAVGWEGGGGFRYQRVADCAAPR